MAKQAKVHSHEKPPEWSEEAVDFINKLLLRKQNQRLGYDRPGTAKSHPWFDNFDWESLENRRMMSPFVGIVIYFCFNFKKQKVGENDSTHLSKQITNEDQGEDKNTFFRNQQVQKLFNDYNFDKAKLANLPKSENSKQESHNGFSDKTTKFTTVNTLTKIS